MSNCEVISIANQKGGVGKTTTTFSLGVALAKQGKKVLLIDADSQGDLTSSMGWHNVDEIPNTLTTLMENYIEDNCTNIDELILHHKENVDLIPSNIDLASLEVRLVNEMKREEVMQNSIESLKDKYDYILIDCMPSLGMMTINALACSDKVIIPVQAEFLSTKGLNQLLHTVCKIKKNRINQGLEVGGILLTMVDERTNLAKNIRQDLEDIHGKIFKVFDNQIPRTIKVAETSSLGESILSYDEKGKVSQAYQNLAKEVLSIGKEKYRYSARDR